jgi:DNA-binding MarR family transcriptional regulator
VNDEAPWLSADELALWRRWLTVNSMLSGVLNRELQADAGLSLPDYEVLVHLTDSAEGRVRVTELARALDWERSRVSHQVTRMQRRGLVERSECRDDGRGSWVVLTRLGRSVIEKAAPGHAKAVRRLIFGDLTEGERKVMIRVMGRILDKLLIETGGPNAGG